jgi:hypothetical protein
MSTLVDPSEIEQIVGTHRHPTRHYARAVSRERRVYILHSQECRDSGVDLRECEFSKAIDWGIDTHDWAGAKDRPVPVLVLFDRLVPDIWEEDS